MEEMPKKENNESVHGEERSEFVAEIQALKDAEMQGGETAHFKFEHFNPQELTEKDREMWNKIKDGSLTWAEWREYSAEIAASEPGRAYPDLSSREIFHAFLGNKASRVLMNKQG